MSGEENLANKIRDYLLSQSAIATPWQLGCSWSSPIEKLLYCAVYYGSKIGISWLELVITDDPKDSQYLGIKFQKNLLDWPVDYCFTVVSDSGVVSKLAVECDGHEFHERTKEQAKRDRERDRRLQDAGFTVYRFTGSEIYRDALSCARQIFAWAELAAWRK